MKKAIPAALAALIVLAMFGACKNKTPINDLLDELDNALTQVVELSAELKEQDDSDTKKALANVAVFQEKTETLVSRIETIIKELTERKGEMTDEQTERLMLMFRSLSRYFV